MRSCPLVTLSSPRYTTAYAESDYTDRDSEKDEGDQEPERDSEEDEESCATVLTLRQEDSQEEEDDEREMVDDDAEEAERSLRLMTEAPPDGELALLLAQSDILHTGDAALKAEGFHLLLANKAEVGINSLAFIPTLSFPSSPLEANRKKKISFVSGSMETAESFYGDWRGRTATCTNAPTASRRKRCMHCKVTAH